MDGPSSAEIIRLERQFSAPRARVYRAWVDPVDLERWAWGTIGDQVHATVDLRVGGEYRISTLRPGGARWSFSGSYVRILPARQLAYTVHWDAPMGYESAKENVVVKFAERDGLSTVIFEHSGVPEAVAAKGHVDGWTNTFDLLEAILAEEARRPAPTGRAPA